MKLVFDIGANNGDVSSHFSNIADKVVAFEPNPNLVPQLKKRFEGTNVIVDGVGLSNKIGIQTFNICDASALSTFSQDWIERSRYSDTHFWNIKCDVEVFTLDAAIEEYGIPDYIKIDVEGYEHGVISGLTKLLDNTLITFEFTEENTNTIINCINHLLGLGYKAFAYTFSDDILLNNQLAWGEYKDFDLLDHLIPELKDSWGMIYVKKEITDMDKGKFNWRENLHGQYVNLDSRPDREAHMQRQLKILNLPLTRMRALPWQEVPQDANKHSVMLKRTPGALGCFYSQMQVMKNAYNNGKHALVCEDDLIFCDDIHERLDYIQDFLNKQENWDVFWLGGTYHIPGQWHNEGHTNPDLRNCECNWHVDAQKTDDEKIVRTFGIWSTYAYIVNFNSIPHILQLLDTHMHESIGIDWSFIQQQPWLHTYAYVPGCVKQMDNQSNIGNGITQFSHFANLGPHWFQEIQEGFDYKQFHNKLENQHLFDNNGKLAIKHRFQLGVLLKELQLHGNIAEIGVAEGLFAKDIADNFDYKKLYLVDLWDHQSNITGDGNFPKEWHNDNYESAKIRLEPHKDKVEFLRGYSHEMASHVEDNSFSLVYTDGDHSYEAVKKDIESWYPKLMTGGIMAFHDYFSEAYGVKKAVEEFCQKNGFEIVIIPEHKVEDAGAYFIKK